MFKKNWLLVLWIVFQAGAFSYYAWLRIHNANLTREPRVFGDTAAYFQNAALPLFSAEFWTHERPPMTALFWKMAGLQPETIAALHLYFSIVSWGVLAFMAARALQTGAAKLVAYSLALAFSLSRDIYMWDMFLGSESISLSFTALFFASSLWLLQSWSWKKAALTIGCALAVVLTRDVFAYFLLMAAFAALFVFFPSRYRLPSFAVALAFALIYVFSAKLSVLGERPYRALLMNTALRVYPSEEYTEYFRAHGMPVDDSLTFLARNPQPGKKFVVYQALLEDPRQEHYRRWAREFGTWEYVKFLWFYKADTLQNVFLQTPGASFYPDVYYYTATGYRPILKDPRLAEWLYPTRFGLVFFFAANLLAAFAAALAWRDKRALWFAPLLMILLTYPQAVLIWAADANDIARHSISHNVTLRLGWHLLICWMLDAALLALPLRWRFLKERSGAKI